MEAETLAKFYMALEHGHVIIPVINKIDLPNARPLEVALRVEEVLGLPADEAIFASGKTGRAWRRSSRPSSSASRPPKGTPRPPEGPHL